MKKQFLKWSLLALPAAFFLLIIGVVELVVLTHKGNLESERKLQTVAFAGDLRARAEAELNRVLHLTSGLSAYLSVHRDALQAEEIRDILRVVHQASSHLRNFGVAVGYELKYVYPEQGNEAVVGMNYRDLPEQWPDVVRAAEEGEAVLSDQIELVQGGRGFVFREPIYIDGAYWGLLSTVIDSDSLLETTFASMDDDRFEFAVRDGGDNPATLWGEERLFSDPEATTVKSIHGWAFAVKPGKLGSSAMPVLVLRLFGWMLGLVASLGIYAAMVHRSSRADLMLHDPVTGLPNPILLNDRISQSLRRSRSDRYRGRPAVIFIGLDDFKPLVGSLAPGAEDLLAHQIARRLEACARGVDTLARWSGDEFIMLAEDIDERHMTKVLQRISEVLAKPLDYQGRQLHLSVSLGYALAGRGAERPMDLIWAADRHRYQHPAQQMPTAAL